MADFDIEAYIAGNLSQAELAQFNEEMRRNPAFAKRVAAQQKVEQHLRTQMIRQQVTKVLSEKPKDGIGGWIWWLVGAFLLAACFLFWRIKAADVPTTSAPTPSTPWKTDTLPNSPSEPVMEEVTPTVQEEKPTGSKRQPIAGLPSPDYPAPSVRGQNEENPDRQDLLNKIWYTEFPPANARFGPKYTEVVALLEKRDFTNAFIWLEVEELNNDKNDTLRFLKGYCLLEKGEADALRYFDGLEVKQPSWKPLLQWYHGLGLILKGDMKKAVPVFKKIAATPAHPYKAQAEKALKLLK